MASNIATNIAAFIIVLGFLIFAHEAGHFVMAKLFRVRVLVFSFGFGKRLFGFKRGDTDYRVSLLPLGGYVRMAGDSPEDEGSGEADELLSKPKWQRFLILLAGPAMNIIIAIVFLAGLLMAGREMLRESQPVIGSLMAGKPAAAAGLAVGDRFVSVGGEAVRTWDDVRLAISMNPGRRIPVGYERDGEARTAFLTPERVVTDYGVTGFAGITPFISTEVGKVLPGSAAETAGLRGGDVIVAANGQRIAQLVDLEKVLDANKDKGIRITVARGGSDVDLTLPAMKSAKETYPGFVPPTEVRKLALGPALSESLRQNWRMVKYTFTVIGRLFKAQGSVKDFSGPISIARISGEMLRTGAQAVIFLMATISLQLGVLNLLPIPVLDGGHIFILLFEGVAGRDLSLNAKERLLRVGFFFLAALMIIVLFNDVIQNIGIMRRG
ncbi:MAG TPA: RIP metalloprotease RseP [Thermoanaerobaculia bacterium]|nr:RIP metalloprotease RseP [Thermoanaerobaculia bacterium]